MATKEQFDNARERVQQLSSRPGNDDLLQLYALYKQATEGDVQGEKPGGFDFKAIAKYNAWENLKGTSEDEARERYVQLVDQLEAKHA